MPTEEHEKVLKAVRVNLQKYDMGFNDCLQLNPDMQAEVDDWIGFVLGQRWEAKIEALRWARKRYMGVPYNLTRGIEEEIAGLEGDRAALGAAKEKS